jgi:hypothetical protein
LLSEAVVSGEFALPKPAEGSASSIFPDATVSPEELKVMFSLADITGLRMTEYVPVKYPLRFPAAILLNPHIDL